MKLQDYISEDFKKKYSLLDLAYSEELIPRSFDEYLDWVKKGYAGELKYLTDERKDLRGHLKRVFTKTESAIICAFDYAPAKKELLEKNIPEIAAYTLGFGGEDYHYALKHPLTELAENLKQAFPELNYQLAIDSTPILERDLAYRAGIGWFGKNSMIINREFGSYFLLGTILLDRKLPFESKQLQPDHCGTCTACIEACPTSAIDPDSRTLKANLCLSTYTIEVFQDEPAPKGYEKSRGEIFGCDICQDVCPWNKKYLSKVLATLTLKEEFSWINKYLISKNLKDLMVLLSSESARFTKKMMKGTAFDRPGKNGWLKNLKNYFTYFQSK